MKTILFHTLFPLAFLFILFSCSALKSKSDEFRRVSCLSKHQDSISLIVEQKSILQSTRDINQIIDRYNTSDYNMKLDDGLENYNDTSLYKQYRLKLSHEMNSQSEDELIGSVLFLVNKSNNKIDHIRGYWILHTYSEELSSDQIKCKLLTHIQDSFFPILQGKTECEDSWSLTLDKGCFIEKYTLEPPVKNDSAELEALYNFRYDVTFI